MTINKKVQLSKKTIGDFRSLFKKDYEINYTDQEAYEAHANPVGFFNLLLKVDRRVNPQNYTKLPREGFNIKEKDISSSF